MARTPLEVVRDHSIAMRTNNVDLILKDYAENAVVLTNLAPQPIVGQEAIRKMIEVAVSGRLERSSESHSTIILQQEEGNYGLHVFEHKEENSLGVETFVVQDDKIIFESSYVTKLK